MNELFEVVFHTFLGKLAVSVDVFDANFLEEIFKYTSMDSGAKLVSNYTTLYCQAYRPIS